MLSTGVAITNSISITHLHPTPCPSPHFHPKVKDDFFKIPVKHPSIVSVFSKVCMHFSITALTTLCFDYWYSFFFLICAPYQIVYLTARTMFNFINLIHSQLFIIIILNKLNKLNE